MLYDEKTYIETLDESAKKIVNDTIELFNSQNIELSVNSLTKEIANNSLLSEVAEKAISYPLYDTDELCDPILKYTANKDAYADAYSNEELGAIVAERGIEPIKEIQAYCAYKADLASMVTQRIKDLDLDNDLDNDLER